MKKRWEEGKKGKRKERKEHAKVQALVREKTIASNANFAVTLGDHWQDNFKTALRL